MIRRILPLLALLACGAIAQNPVSTPSLTVTPASATLPQVTQVSVSVVKGQAAGPTYYYWVVARYSSGNSSPSGPWIALGAPNTLDSQHYVSLSFQGVSNATGYDVLRTTTRATPAGACGCGVSLNSQSTLVLDQSNSLSAYTVSTYTPQSFVLQQIGANLDILSKNGATDLGCIATPSALCGGGGGTTVSVNGSQVTAPNFNGTTPAAPAGYLNGLWQVSTNNVSLYVPNFATLLGCASPTAGTVSYFNGTSWVCLAGNSGSTNFLSESSAGVPSWASGSGTTAFSGITGGTNTGAAMVVGSGASLGTTGTGTIGATSIGSPSTPGQFWSYNGTSQAWTLPSLTVSPISATTYPLAATDRATLLDLTAGGQTIDLLAESTAGNGFYFNVRNYTATADTITPNGTDTINGTNASATLNANSSGYVVASASGAWKFTQSPETGGGTPGGSSGQVQYDNAGAFGGTPNAVIGTSPGVMILSPGAADVPLEINTPASPTADLLDLDINGTKASYFDSGGALHVPSCTGCGSSYDPTTTLRLFDDFNSGTPDPGVYVGLYSWKEICATLTGGALPSGSVNDYFGTFSCATSTTSGNVATVALDNNGSGYVVHVYNTVASGTMEFRVSLGSTATNSAFFGLGDSNNPDGEAGNYYIGFAFNTADSDTDWMCVEKNGGTETRVDTGVAPSTTDFQDLTITWTSPGNVNCQVGTATAVAMSGAFPTAVVVPDFSETTNAASAAKFYADFFYLNVPLSR